MSNALPLRQILTTLRQALFSGFNPNSIVSGGMRTTLSLNDIVVKFEGANRSGDGPEASMTDTHEYYHFSFMVPAPLPPAAGNPDEDLELVKCDMANQVYACVMVRQIWAGIANFPLVTEVNFADIDPVANGRIEISGKFVCQSGTNWF